MIYHCEFSRPVYRTCEGTVVCRLQLIHSGYLNIKHRGGSRGAGTKATMPQEAKKGSPLKANTDVFWTRHCSVLHAQNYICPIQLCVF